MQWQAARDTAFCRMQWQATRDTAFCRMQWQTARDNAFCRMQWQAARDTAFYRMQWQAARDTAFRQIKSSEETPYRRSHKQKLLPDPLRVGIEGFSTKMEPVNIYHHLWEQEEFIRVFLPIDMFIMRLRSKGRIIPSALQLERAKSVLRGLHYELYTPSPASSRLASYALRQLPSYHTIVRWAAADRCIHNLFCQQLAKYYYYIDENFDAKISLTPLSAAGCGRVMSSQITLTQSSKHTPQPIQYNSNVL